GELVGGYRELIQAFYAAQRAKQNLPAIDSTLLVTGQVLHPADHTKAEDYIFARVAEQTHRKIGRPEADQYGIFRAPQENALQPPFWIARIKNYYSPTPEQAQLEQDSPDLAVDETTYEVRPEKKVDPNSKAKSGRSKKKDQLEKNEDELFRNTHLRVDWWEHFEPTGKAAKSGAASVAKSVTSAKASKRAGGAQAKGAANKVPKKSDGQDASSASRARRSAALASETKTKKLVDVDDGADDQDSNFDDLPLSTQLASVAEEAEEVASEKENDDSEEGTIPLSQLADIMNNKRRQASSSSSAPSSSDVEAPPAFSIELLRQWQNLTYKACGEKKFQHQLVEVGTLIHWGPRKQIFTSKHPPRLTAAAWKAVAQDLTQDHKSAP
ncbi:MAG: hypothetical protein P4L67_00080, partial [Candidatus Pacebacteria bacterium]|nr:hypothetical protein [Candidatus Paceibacterota bacterium]